MDALGFVEYTQYHASNMADPVLLAIGYTDRQYVAAFHDDDRNRFEVVATQSRLLRPDDILPAAVIAGASEAVAIEDGWVHIRSHLGDLMLPEPLGEWTPRFNDLPFAGSLAFSFLDLTGASVPGLLKR